MAKPRLGVLILPSQSAAQVVRLARQAERVGLDAVWIPDERFYRDPYQLLALVAAATERVLVGPCVTDPYTRPPTQNAVAIATLDEVSDGRAQLGIGAGVSGFAELGIERNPPPVPAVRDAVSTIRRYLQGAPRARGGLGIDFGPRRRELPVYVAAEGPGMLRLAGAIADAVILQAKVAPALHQAAAEQVGRAATASGRSVRIVSRVDVSIADEAKVAYDALRPRVVRRLISSAPDFAPFRLAGLVVSAELATRVAATPYTNDHQTLAGLGQAVTDEMVDAFCIATTASDLGRRMRGHVALGADELLLHPVPNSRLGVEDMIGLLGAWHSTADETAESR